MPVSDVVKYVKIADLLHTAGQPKAEQFSDISAEGFKLVINLGLHNDPRYSVPEEPDILKSQGIEYIHIPVKFAAPSIEDLNLFFDAMKRAEGQKTLVHCAHNKRVAVFLALYRVLVQGWAADVAFNAAAEVWPPDEVWSGFFNDVVGARG